MRQDEKSTHTLGSLKAGILSAAMVVAASFAAAIVFSGTPLEAQPHEAELGSR
ncbi:hypothetical protein [Parerythrobacter aestuarii]|uniref:hypothetical protein n=1 Tax=Parerythrobacter aestuarii TaxID=3020909 RepID=UPI0024DE59E9|nr:hypothetical protein [Parerythrobacter aestuarii]